MESFIFAVLLLTNEIAYYGEEGAIAGMTIERLQCGYQENDGSQDIPANDGSAMS
jgi:hypothetical protein